MIREFPLPETESSIKEYTTKTPLLLTEIVLVLDR